MSSKGRLAPPLMSRVGGQPAQGHLHTPRRGGPGRVLVGCWAIARMVSLFTCDKGRPFLVFQMGRMVVVQGETFLEVLGSSPYPESTEGVGNKEVLKG